jgi:hypothetical protein
MKRNTLIEHKETTIVCEEGGPVSMSYNALLTTPKVNAKVKLVVPIVTTKSALTYTNCGKIGHVVETCHNRKRKVQVVPTVIIKSTKLVIGTKTQLVKLEKIPIHYPCIICSNVEHRSGECPQKIEIQNMFKSKLVSYNATTTFKLPKLTICQLM